MKQKPSKKQKREQKERAAEKRDKIKRKKSTPEIRPWVAPKMKLYSVSNPFYALKDVPRDQKIAGIREAGERANSAFLAKYALAEKWFETYDPIYTLSMCATYFATTPEGVDPEISGRMAFPPHLLEILQAIALTRERGGSLEPLHNKALELRADMRELGDLMMQRLARIPEGLPEADIESYMVRTNVMAHTIAVRNWAFHHQMFRITKDLASILDIHFETTYGVKASRFVDILFGLLDTRTDLLNEHRDRLRPVARARDHKEIIAAYTAAFPGIAEMNPDEVDQIWEKAGRVRENLLGMILAHSDLRLEDIYTIKYENIVALAEDAKEAEGVWNLIDSLTLKFGDLKHENKEYFVLQNPVTKKPFVDLGNGRRFSIMWRVLAHNMLDIIESLIWSDQDLQGKYTQAKGKYLEDELEKLFKKAFPNAQIYPGSLWSDSSGKGYENDLLVIIDSFAIVVEAKSGIITDPAKRGAPDRLFKTYRELVGEPSEQATRFIKFLSENKAIHAFPTMKGGTNTINSAQIKYYVPLGVTLSHLGSIGSNLKQLLDAKILKGPLEELAPSMNFTDLEIILEILDSEAERLHYLARRREFEAHVIYQGDEIDLFAFYLETGFNIGDEEYSRRGDFHLDMKGKEIHPYVIGTSEGRRIPKPKLVLHPYWVDLLTTVQARKPEGWMETCFVLLNISAQDQETFFKGFEKRQKDVYHDRLTDLHNWVLITSGPDRRRFVVAGYPYKTNDKSERNDMLGEILYGDDTPESRGAIAIGVDINWPHYPYTIMARRLSTDLFDTLTLERS